MYDELKRYKTKKRSSLVLSIICGLLLVFSVFMSVLSHNYKTAVISESPKTELIYNRNINKLVYPITDFNDVAHYMVESFSMPAVSSTGYYVIYYISDTPYCIVAGNFGGAVPIKIIERSQVGSTDRTIGYTLASYNYGNYTYTRAGSSSGMLKTPLDLIRIGSAMPGYQTYWSQVNIFRDSPVAGVDYFNQYYVTNNDNVEYDIAYREGEAFGYERGYAVGETDGYYDGYIDGKNYVVDYPSFFSLYTEQEYLAYGESRYTDGADTDLSTRGFKVLLTQIFNAPYNVLHNILNFELFGVNLWTLFSFIFTCGLIIFVVKLIRK